MLEEFTTKGGARLRAPIPHADPAVRRALVPHAEHLLDDDREPDKGQVAIDEALPRHGPAVPERVQPFDSEDDGNSHDGEHADHRVPVEIVAQRGP